MLHFADQGEAALERLAGEIEPQLIVILGHQHAGHGWLQLLGEIKHRLPDLPVMMITAYGDDERRRHADDLGAPAIWRRRRCCSTS